MLFSSDDKQTSELYEQNLKDLGFKRFDGRFKSDYHTTIGYIDDVEEWDVEDLTKYLNFSLENHIKNKVNSSGINFEFGTTATLGKSTPCLVAIPKNAEIFIELNKFLQSLVIDYQHHKYRLKKITLPGYYVPHLSLNGQVYREIKITDLSKTMTVVNQRLKGKIIKFDKLVIR
jgi:hypothetical protein